MSGKTYYKLYKQGSDPYLIDIGISSYEVRDREYGKLELGRGLRIFTKKFSSEDFGINDVITLKWNMLPENSKTFTKIYSLSKGDVINFIASGNFNMNISAEVIDIVYQDAKVLFKNNIRAREASLQLSIISKS